MKELSKVALTKVEGGEGWPDLTWVGVLEEFIDVDLNDNGQVGILPDGWPFF